MNLRRAPSPVIRIRIGSVQCVCPVVELPVFELPVVELPVVELPGL